MIIDINTYIILKDCKTRYLWSVPLKDKKGETVFNAFKSIMNKSGRQPKNYSSIKEKNFIVNIFSTILKFKKENIMKKDKDRNYLNCIYSVFNPNKANLIERVIRTNYEKLEKHFDFTAKKEWVKILPKLTEEYNNTIHSTIKTTPKKASNNPKLRKETPEKLNDRIAKFKESDKVLIAKIKSQFEKGGKTDWIKEVVKVDKVNSTNPITYQITDKDNEPIHSGFYEEELQKIRF